jgi:hypothetical protein
MKGNRFKSGKSAAFVAVISIGISLSVLSLLESSQAANSPSKSRSRIEELFVWRVSDTLGLTPDVESRFSMEFKKLSEKKANLWDELESLLNAIDHEKDPKKLAASLAKYKKKMILHGKIQIEEFETFEKLFGKEKFAKYLVLKRDLTQKLKDFISTPSRPDSTPPKRQLEEPKVIQDESQ